MAKTQHVVSLYGVDINGKKVSTHQADQVEEFVGDTDNKCEYFKVTFPDLGVCCIKTPKGEYLLEKHASLNVFIGKALGVKVHATFKKVVGHLTYWA